MNATRRAHIVLATTYALAVVLLIALVDTQRLTPALRFAHSVPLGDKVGHLLLMGALACVVELATGARHVALAGVPLRAGSSVVAVVVVLEEISQQWVPARSFDYGDLAADALGIAIGGAIGAWTARLAPS